MFRISRKENESIEFHTSGGELIVVSVEGINSKKVVLGVDAPGVFVKRSEDAKREPPAVPHNSEQTAR